MDGRRGLKRLSRDCHVVLGSEFLVWDARIRVVAEFWLQVEFVAAVGSTFEKWSCGRMGRIPPLGGVSWTLLEQ
jgi:hypothetical protein